MAVKPRAPVPKGGGISSRMEDYDSADSASDVDGGTPRQRVEAAALKAKAEAAAAAAAARVVRLSPSSPPTAVHPLFHQLLAGRCAGFSCGTRGRLCAVHGCAGMQPAPFWLAGSWGFRASVCGCVCMCVCVRVFFMHGCWMAWRSAGDGSVLEAVLGHCVLHD